MTEYSCIMPNLHLVLLPDSKYRPPLLPSTGYRDVNRGVSADAMYPLRATGKGQRGVKCV